MSEEKLAITPIEEDESLENRTVNYADIEPNFESVVDYNTKIANFDGPLDLLLHLVTKAKISIREIFVSQVTEQFLAYIENAVDLDIEKESEYLGMAATLLEIKSKSVLPVVDFDDGFEQYDPAEELYQQLEEYKLMKEASVKLKDKETTQRFYKEPDDKASDVRIVYKDFNLEGLVKAFSDLLIRADLEKRIKTAQKEIPKEVFTVANKVNYLKEYLLEKESCYFTELFHEHATRPEIITTFQALLELLKVQYLAAEQDGTYGDIIIKLREDRSDGDIGDLSEYN